MDITKQDVLGRYHFEIQSCAKTKKASNNKKLNREHSFWAFKP